MTVLPLTVSRAEIEAAKSPRGSWTRTTLATWGVNWPPVQGWRYALENGLPIPTRDNPTTKPEIEPPRPKPVIIDSDEIPWQVDTCPKSPHPSHQSPACVSRLTVWDG